MTNVEPEITQEIESSLKPKKKLKIKNWMRNKQCICKSGKKFKNCCWNKLTSIKL